MAKPLDAQLSGESGVLGLAFPWNGHRGRAQCGVHGRLAGGIAATLTTGQQVGCLVRQEQLIGNPVGSGTSVRQVRRPGVRPPGVAHGLSASRRWCHPRSNTSTRAVVRAAVGSSPVVEFRCICPSSQAGSGPMTPGRARRLTITPQGGASAGWLAVNTSTQWRLLRCHPRRHHGAACTSATRHSAHQ